MEQFQHENNLINVSAATAKENTKKISRYRLFIAMATACFVAPTAFLIYFSVKSDVVGIWAFAITAFLAAAAATVIFVCFLPRMKEAQTTIKNFLSSGGEMKKTPPLDVFCVTTVKVMFTVMAALIVCAIPTLITVCHGMTFVETLTYMGNCLGSFWGMATPNNDFFAYIVGLALMAAIFALILLLIKFINKLLK